MELTEPSSQPYQYTIFISRCNGHLGSQLVEAFRNDNIIETNPNVIVGTINPKDPTPHSDCVEVVDVLFD